MSRTFTLCLSDTQIEMLISSLIREKHDVYSVIDCYASVGISLPDDDYYKVRFNEVENLIQQVYDRTSFV